MSYHLTCEIPNGRSDDGWVSSLTAHHAVALKRTGMALQRAGVALQRAGVALQRTAVALQRAAVALQRTGVALQRMSGSEVLAAETPVSGHPTFPPVGQPGIPPGRIQGAKTVQTFPATRRIEALTRCGSEAANGAGLSPARRSP